MLCMILLDFDVIKYIVAGVHCVCTFSLVLISSKVYTSLTLGVPLRMLGVTRSLESVNVIMVLQGKYSRCFPFVHDPESPPPIPTKQMKFLKTKQNRLFSSAVAATLARCYTVNYLQSLWISENEALRNIHLGICNQSCYVLVISWGFQYSQ